ncbi:hypothetical protein CGRA01v4_09855 [Colletotrichum graminicola]|uniref:Uncharacterized protein n=1 Tax=Colletotrichum graminicola (strain M1.001 / M2 / FGSC 10212) TaxID=645133 RepID=E3QXR8_COLGM|nr:uncharacterized protein GLRG_10815 [Colletotrichum graminicola M1.001]EFQ35671.1 hypothetical protein GLRG_10815 [Colletotrichum graminicola M1.001]WDK18570.1 hypothetical protein CGRA01v4_09855 [Colletotrichum graminicola]
MSRLEPCGPGTDGDPTRRYVRRQPGGSCPLIPDPAPGSGSGGGNGQTDSFTSGPQPSPTFAAAGACGGTFCEGFWCNPRPTSVPPDERAPRLPRPQGPQQQWIVRLDPDHLGPPRGHV